MTIDIKAPQFPESVADGTIATWYKQPGEAVSRDELIVDIETDKVVLEVVAPQDGTLSDIIKAEGDTVLSEEVIAVFTAGAAPAAEAQTATAAEVVSDSSAEPILSPAARKLADEKNIDPKSIVGTGKGGRISKEDVEKAVASSVSIVAPAPAPAPAVPEPAVNVVAGERVERRVPMTRMRARIAERLLGATQETAMLTTFNEVNMAPVMELRNKYKELFQQSHNGTKLGFMSFFCKGSYRGIKAFPCS